jgi:hypothetical protein
MIRACAILVALVAIPSINAGQPPASGSRMRDHRAPHSRPSRLRIGGLVRVNWVSTYDALLVDDRFQTSAIPVAGSPEASRGGRVNVIASPSRFNFDLRTPTGGSYMRAFIEGDFAPLRATRCGFAMRTVSGSAPFSVRRGPRFQTLKPSPTASTSKD